MRKLMVVATMLMLHTAQGQTIINGTNDNPTIVNHTGKPIIGYALQKNTTTGSYLVEVFDIDWVAKDMAIQPGEERSALGLARVFHSGGQGQVVGHTLLAVLFSDGSFEGSDELRQDFSALINKWRGAAQDLRQIPDRHRVMEVERKDRFSTHPRAILSGILMGIKESRNEVEAEAALERVTSIPDVKGEK